MFSKITSNVRWFLRPQCWGMVIPEYVIVAKEKFNKNFLLQIFFTQQAKNIFLYRWKTPSWRCWCSGLNIFRRSFSRRAETILASATNWAPHCTKLEAASATSSSSSKKLRENFRHSKNSFPWLIDAVFKAIRSLSSQWDRYPFVSLW